VAVAGEGGATPPGAQPLPIDPVAVAKQACLMGGLVWDDANATCKPAGTVLPGAPPPPPPAAKSDLVVPLLVGSVVILGALVLKSVGKKKGR
jgi:hypothetical protein